jgi:hypothetical protein
MRPFGSHPDTPIPISNNQVDEPVGNSLSCHAWATWHAICAKPLRCR